MTLPRFTIDDAQRAHDEWGANCGPGAIAAICGLTLDELRPSLAPVAFETKRYTSPLMMWATLDGLGVNYTVKTRSQEWPTHGLCRVQWEGPWMAPNIPRAARYRHTHWVGARTEAGSVEVFDINCMSVGGWVQLSEWSGRVVPWLLRHVAPRNTGKWHLTHVVEVRP